MLGSVLLAAADSATQNTSIFSPASPPAQSIHNLSILVFAITGFIFVVVEGVLFYSVFPLSPAKARCGSSRGTTEPPQVYGSRPIEIAWTAAPLLIVVVIVLVSARTLWEVEYRPAASRSRATMRCSSRSSAGNGGGNTRYDQYNGRSRSASSRPTNCISRSAKTARRGRFF